VTSTRIGLTSSVDVDNPFVSIIIPTYNGGKMLEETLSSCMKIKGVPVEILVIDDGSTDGTPERILRRFPFIRLHRLELNTGSGAAGRNAGLAIAKGLYVKFLDHDDLIQPRGFREECREAQRSDADIVMARWAVTAIDANDRGRFLKNNLKAFTPPSPDRLIEAILLGESMPYTAAALYKRSYIHDQEWDPRTAVIDDYDWFCRMAARGGLAKSVDSISYYWRLHDYSIQGRRHKGLSMYLELTATRHYIYTKVEAMLLHGGQLTPTRRQLLARRYYDFLRCFARHDPIQCRLLLARIYQLDPSFRPDSGCERDRRILSLIRLVGLRPFLAWYGALQRLRDRLRRRLSISLHP
jgi:glycosyltransferase involved in cell wall biosynthesis